MLLPFSSLIMFSQTGISLKLQVKARILRACAPLEKRKRCEKYDIYAGRLQPVATGTSRRGIVVFYAFVLFIVTRLRESQYIKCSFIISSCDIQDRLVILHVSVLIKYLSKINYTQETSHPLRYIQFKKKSTHLKASLPTQ